MKYSLTWGCFKFPNKLTSMKLMASLVIAKVRKLSRWQNIKLEKKQNCRSQTKLQELLTGVIVNKECLRKRLYPRIEMSFKHIMIQSVNKHCMCSLTVIVTKQQNRIHGILFWIGNGMKQNLYVETKHLRLYIEASLFWWKHYVLKLTPFHSFHLNMKEKLFNSWAVFCYWISISILSLKKVFMADLSRFVKKFKIRPLKLLKSTKQIIGLLPIVKLKS